MSTRTSGRGVPGSEALERRASCGTLRRSGRGVVTNVGEPEHGVQQSSRPADREIGIAADSAIMLPNMLRKLDEPLTG